MSSIRCRTHRLLRRQRSEAGFLRPSSCGMMYRCQLAWSSLFLLDHGLTLRYFVIIAWMFSRSLHSSKKLLSFLRASNISLFVMSLRAATPISTPISPLVAMVAVRVHRLRVRVAVRDLRVPERIHLRSTISLAKAKYVLFFLPEANS